MNRRILFGIVGLIVIFLVAPHRLADPPPLQVQVDSEFMLIDTIQQHGLIIITKPRIHGSPHPEGTTVVWK